MNDLPKYVQEKRLVGGKSAFYWNLPTWAKPPITRNGKECPIVSTALGGNRKVAIEKADAINEAFAGWREGYQALEIVGTVRWLFAWYRKTDKFTQCSQKTRTGYIATMELLERYPMKVGFLGTRDASKIDGLVADTLYKKLRQKGDRQASFAMQVCRLVWNQATRHSAVTGVKYNPFAKMGLTSRAKDGNRATTRAEYNAYREAARNMGYQGFATAAALGFELCQRVTDVFSYEDNPGDAPRGFLWSGYEAGKFISLTQSKTAKLHTIPLTDDSGEIALYAELESELALTPRLGPQVVLDPETCQPYVQRRANEIHRRICDRVGLSKQMTMTGFRHGGATEIGDLGEADPRAITGHTELKTTAIYNKATTQKAVQIGLARLKRKSELTT